MTQIIPANRSDAALMNALFLLWRDSVAASHHFLSEQEIAAIANYVPDALAGVDELLVAMKGDQVAALMGIEADKLEMLFVAPEFFGCGIGRQMVQLAFEKGVRHVAVNEQNPQAVDFYKKMGFVVRHRCEVDEQGNPYPILLMTVAL